MRVAIIGSGPAGVAAATALIEAGWSVDMVDAGRARPASCAALADRLLHELSSRGRPKLRTLNLLRGGGGGSTAGAKPRPSWPGKGLMDPGRTRKRVLGSQFAFEATDRLLPVTGGDPPRALAVGGLSNVWGAACYASAAGTTAAWPPGSAPQPAHYRRAVEFLGVDQEEDGLAQAYPLFGQEGKAAPRNTGSALEALLERWRAQQSELAAAGFQAGRSRLAVSFSGSKACRNCGLCFTGCPTDAIFHSDQRLDPLAGNERFRFLGETFVLAFREGAGGTLSLETVALDGDPQPPLTGYDRVVLAAGALSSFRIAAQSLGDGAAEAPLLDNDMIILPFLARSRPQRVAGRHLFALSEAALSFSLGPQAEDCLHAQFYALHPYFLGPAGDLLESLPGWLAALPRAALSRFLVGFLYLPGHLSRQARLRAEPGPEAGPWRLTMSSHEQPQAAPAFRQAIERIGRCRGLALQPVRSLQRSTPFGFSGHLGGTMPMQAQPRGLQTDANGRLAADPRVAVADAAAFPSVSAPNPTLTVVAQAFRVAELLGPG